MENRLDNLRAERNNIKAYVRFINLTERTVDIIWINFSGSYVRYKLLERGCFVDIDTYKGHPWIAFDYNTRDRLHIEKQFVYYPKTGREVFQERYPDKVCPPDFERRLQAVITIPLYSLRYTSLLAARNLLRVAEDVDQLELPKELVADLKKVITQRNRQPKPLIRNR